MPPSLPGAKNSHSLPVSNHRYYKQIDRVGSMFTDTAERFDFSMPLQIAGKPFEDEKNIYCENN
jgi:hypothetical protein